MFESLIEQLKNKALSLDDRLGAILGLIKFYDDLCYQYLEPIIDDNSENSELRSAAALGLGKLGDVSLDLLNKHIKDDDPIVRNYVVQALGMLGEKAIPSIITALEDKENDVFYSAADTIGSLGSVAVPYLIELLESGKDDIKCIAAWKLGEIQDARAIPALSKTIRNENNNKDILALTTWALGEIARKTRNNKSIIAALYIATRYKNPEIKRLAYIALRKARDYIN